MKKFAARMNGSIQHIFPPFVTVIYLSLPQIILHHQYLLIVHFLIAALCISGFGYILNDYFDKEIDLAAGKKNITHKMNSTMVVFIMILLVSVGLANFYLYVNNELGFYFLLLQILILFIYSAPPFRFKKNAILGPLIDAHYGHIVPVFIALISFSIQFDWWIYGLIYFTLLCKGLRNIINHQVSDRKEDRTFKLKTFPNLMGPLRTIYIINYVILPFEFISLCILIFLASELGELPVIIFTSFIAFNALLFSAWKFGQWELKRELKFKFLYFLNDFYEYWLPILCLWIIPVNFTVKCIITVIHLIIFNSIIPKFGKDFRKIGINIGLIRT